MTRREILEAARQIRAEISRAKGKKRRALDSAQRFLRVAEQHGRDVAEAEIRLRRFKRENGL